MTDWYFLEKDSEEIKRERKKAQELKASQWWKNIKAKGTCHYCQKKFAPDQITMDHLVPVARGGKSNKGNVVPACKGCNQSKKLTTPVEQLLEKIKKENE